MPNKPSTKVPVGVLPEEFSQRVVTLLEVGDIILEERDPKIAAFNLGRFGVPDVPERLGSKTVRKELQAFILKCQRDLPTVDKSELEAWLLAIGLLLAHMRDANMVGLQELLLLYEFAGDCSQTVRFLRIGRILMDSPVAAVDWFIDLVPTIPPNESGKGFLVASTKPQPT